MKPRAAIFRDCNLYVERLAEKFMPEPMSGCWLWMGAATARGYGHMYFHGRFEKAHRIAYLLFRGEIPDGHHVLHKCDTPSCVNPDHLRVGTAKENIRDCMAKGRDRRGSFSSGEKHPHMKLTDQQVSEIRARKGGRGLGSALAREFGVGPSVISDIRRNKVRT